MVYSMQGKGLYALSLSVFDHMTTERSFPITAITTYDGSRINMMDNYNETGTSYMHISKKSSYNSVMRLILI